MRSTTVKIGKIEVDVDYEYHPYEPPTREYPGCSEEYEITKIEYKGQDVTDLVFELVDYMELVEKIEDSFKF